MSPLPFWLGISAATRIASLYARVDLTGVLHLCTVAAGAQNVALNFSPIENKVDAAVQLHFALFDGSAGFVLKPPEMRRIDAGSLSRASSMASIEEGEDGEESVNADDDDDYWPPARKQLHRTTIEVISLHNLTKRGEQRPRFDTANGSCHKYVPELSGASVPPDSSEASEPELTFSIQATGGFCAVTRQLPVPQQNVKTELDLPIATNGMNATFADTVISQYRRYSVHCIAAEPHATFVRVSVTDRGQKVAFEAAVLGRLKRGYRVIQLRGKLGTRIELACLFVRISFGTEPNFFVSPRQARCVCVAGYRQLRLMCEPASPALRYAYSTGNSSRGAGPSVHQRERRTALSDSRAPVAVAPRSHRCKLPRPRRRSRNRWPSTKSVAVWSDPPLAALLSCVQRVHLRRFTRL